MVGPETGLDTDRIVGPGIGRRLVRPVTGHGQDGWTRDWTQTGWLDQRLDTGRMVGPETGLNTGRMGGPEMAEGLDQGLDTGRMVEPGTAYHRHIALSLTISVAAQLASVCSFKVPEGGVASLSCQYSVKRFGLSRVCWGRGCGTFWCSNILVQTDQNGVISKVADRYRLTGDIMDGQVDLDILGVKWTDSGPYCCRVDVDGLFNDKKVIMNLRVVKVPVTISPPTTTTTIPTTTAAAGQATEMPTSTVNWRILLSSQLDLLRRNSTLLRSDIFTVEDSVPSLSLQVNAPVLSLSLSVLFILVAVFLLMAFKRGIHRQALKTDCFSSEEPPHIIYEIRMRRPVQENIYTLD